MRFFNSDKMRFLLTGGFNTLLSYLMYVFFLRFFYYAVAYSLSFILTVMISYLINTRFVFQAKFSLKKFLTFPCVYLVQYVAGLFLLHIFIVVLNISPLVAPFMVVLLTLPITFLLSKFILTSR